MPKTRVVITGAGVISSLAHNRQDLLAALLNRAGHAQHEQHATQACLADDTEGGLECGHRRVSGGNGFPIMP